MLLFLFPPYPFESKTKKEYTILRRELCLIR